MLYSEQQIKTKAWLVVEIVNMMLLSEKLSVDKLFLVGSYASGKQTEWSDLDFVVVLKDELAGLIKPRRLYPSWDMIEQINAKIDNNRVHVIFGSEEAVKSLHQKHRHEKKDYSYKQIQLGDIHAVTYTARA
jgi:predicted nucleotidyltransferase